MTYNTIPYLQQEYETQRALFERQPAILQRFLEGQARFIADALITKMARVRFSLPDRVVTQLSPNGKDGALTIPPAERQIKVGGFLQGDVHEALLHRFNEMEKSADPGIAVSAGCCAMPQPCT